MFLDFGKGEQSHEREPEWFAQMQQNQQRWFAFLTKLEERMDELGEAALPELIAVFADDSDEFHRTYLRLRAGIIGQFEQIRTKAVTVFEENILNFSRLHSHPLALHRDALFQFEETCRKRHGLFEEKCRAWLERITATGHEDLELKYREILTEFEATRDDFHCIQCGAPIRLERIYFITTYLACPACKTQNTFTPSSRASRLEHLGRSLAEQRCAPLLAAYQQQRDNERVFYMQAHEIGLTHVHEKDAAARDRAIQDIADLNRKRKESIATSHVIYRRYLRAMFDEWNGIVPDLAGQNEKFYGRLLADFEEEVRRDSTT